MSRVHSRFIPGEEVGTVTDWAFGAVDAGSVRFAAKLKAQAEAEKQAKVDVVRQAGFSDGYAQGFAQGHAQALMEGQRQLEEYIRTQGTQSAQQFGQLFASAREQLAQAEQMIAQGVLELACELSRQIVRQELTSNPNALQPVVREALGMLAADSRAVTVRLHELDREVLADVLAQEFPALGLTLVSDPGISRGGCVVMSAGTVVDGTVEKRWKRALASLGLESDWEHANDAG
jgi:flagellar assembly protein FliH